MSEEILRAKSAEMLNENEDMHVQMQQLLGLLGDMGEDSSAEGSGEAPPHDFLLPANLFSPANPAQFANRTAPQVAHISWLKLKAALRWGIFVRKRAAQRRSGMAAVREEREAEEDADGYNGAGETETPDPDTYSS